MAKQKRNNTEERTRDIWYQLDTAANLFPAISNDDNTNVFRLACELHEPIHPDLLQQALDTAIEAFPYFRVVMRRGLFWFYLERTAQRPVVSLEQKRPCARLFYKQIKQLLFEVTYFGNRINLEVFHAVADGTGALDLLQSIVYHYLLLAHPNEFGDNLPLLTNQPTPAGQSLDGFVHHYSPSEKASPFKGRAYTIGGTLLPPGHIRVINASMPTSSILSLAKEHNSTVTAYLAALMICAIHQELMPKRAEGRSIHVNIPVDLRGHFSSQTSRNFFSVVEVGYNFLESNASFDDVLASVTDQLQLQVRSDMLEGRLNYNMSMRNNPFSRFTPLIIKNRIIRAAYNRAERVTTCALSNMGRITMPEEFTPYIDRFSCLLNPTRLHRWKACVCSFQDIFVINFTSCIAETSPHKYIVRHLTEAGIPVCITCNGGIDDEVL